MIAIDIMRAMTLSSEIPDPPPFPSANKAEDVSLTLQITPEDFAASQATYAAVREIITKTTSPRSILYVGMHDDWATPLAVADADRVTGVDVAYWGLDKTRAEVQRFTASGRTREPKSRYEARSFVLEITDLQRMMSEMTMTFGRRPEIRRPWIPGGHYALEFAKDGRRRHIDFLTRDIDRWRPPKESFPFIMMRRTFPGPVAWSRLLPALEHGGLLFTTGYGYGKKGSEDTGSGVDIDNSPVPLYFSSQSIGLRTQTSDRQGGWYLYKKFQNADRRRIAAILRAGGQIDTLLDDTYLTDVVEEMGQDGSFIPKPREALPLLWDERTLVQKFNVIGKLAGDGIIEKNTWLNILDRALHQLRALERRTYDFQERYWEPTEYLPDGQPLADALRAYYQRIIAVAQRAAFP